MTVSRPYLPGRFAQQCDAGGATIDGKESPASERILDLERAGLILGKRDGGLQTAMRRRVSIDRYVRTLAALQRVSRTLAARSPDIDAALGKAARTMDNAARFTDDLSRLVHV